MLRLGNGIPDLNGRLETLRSECFDKEYEKKLMGDLEDLFKLDKAYEDEIMKNIQSYSQCGMYYSDKPNVFKCLKLYLAVLTKIQNNYLPIVLSIIFEYLIYIITFG